MLVVKMVLKVEILDILDQQSSAMHMPLMLVAPISCSLLVIHPGDVDAATMLQRETILDMVTMMVICTEMITGMFTELMIDSLEKIRLRSNTNLHKLININYFIFMRIHDVYYMLIFVNVGT